MFKIIDTDGRLQTCEGIDLNLWYNDQTDAVELVGYPMDKNARGLWDTNTQSVVFWAKTDFDTEDYYDEWYGLSADTLPHEIPADVLDLVNRILAEIDLADTPVYAETLAAGKTVLETVEW
jgi:hypothetical protein